MSLYSPIDLNMLCHMTHHSRWLCNQSVHHLYMNETKLQSLLRKYIFNVFQEPWIRAGLGSNIMYIPIHNLAEKMNPDMCKVIFPLHHLTVCDSTSKFGTNAAGLNETPDKYLQDFGKDSTNIDLVAVEHYLPCTCLLIWNVVGIQGSTKIPSLPPQQKDHCGPSSI